MRKLTKVVCTGGVEIEVGMEFDAWVRTFMDALGHSTDAEGRVHQGDPSPVVQVENAAGAPVLITIAHVVYALPQQV